MLLSLNFTLRYWEATQALQGVTILLWPQEPVTQIYSSFFFSFVAATAVFLLHNKGCSIGWRRLSFIVFMEGGACAMIAWFYAGFSCYTWRVFPQRQLLTQLLVPYSWNQGYIHNWDFLSHKALLEFVMPNM